MQKKTEPDRRTHRSNGDRLLSLLSPVEGIFQSVLPRPYNFNVPLLPYPPIGPPVCGKKYIYSTCYSTGLPARTCDETEKVCCGFLI